MSERKAPHEMLVRAVALAKDSGTEQERAMIAALVARYVPKGTTNDRELAYSADGFFGQALSAR